MGSFERGLYKPYVRRYSITGAYTVLGFDGFRGFRGVGVQVQGLQV